ncbi:MAG: tRNA uridine-5-carboxymethylaminomethyl(34) synthesis GTPase MnmE [Nitrospinae bacterium RIFCSPLOWO2_02_39_17]|nr:MAG: tRNA uridine-5-carboxymethylaminomethyl(34) synthesis GTPase MnmE [Nitrospinae bacterium RIFCSPHIGHO2_02_39_11]OGV98688.1 MAG: tRNA uridine-5-carboxymethylaminomethyl(34) synthesis GTPase MnmE [Nitrospinae bacterium RIFCSPHIGHO2_12_FULL_39_42]OGW07324.1 MAG: tRNA uridine-5-carboxymethylaminomethyl(34) synthesis GTPase MnmE [Nitrospinae bacterium RIFCSPLOWO2_02_39_17]OGW11308.1 MAG: tRNA uridine-5-carboxymethylaminomethyl(34) synthesis GTPase MnmE [Nitrospinae bacterium RIFCSPLOWO2_12_39_
MSDLTDTISAISTPHGEGGIGIIRMSGPASIAIAKKIFITPKGESLNGIESHKVIYGYIRDPDTRKRIDEVLLTIMHSPRSFTREDMVEISCHGGFLPIRRILDLTLINGARLAEPGEFTKKAFLNGRINLLQAEAVIDIIKSSSDIALESAMIQLEGGLAKKITSMRAVLINILAEIEVSIDFPDEDIEFKELIELQNKLKSVIEDIEQLIDTYKYGKIYREGASVVIAGRPNVGKSSLMNAILNEERAIVTSIPGTTRDTIEEGVNIKGLTINIVDTAGIREAEGLIELEGIKKTRTAIERGGLIIFLIDGSEDLKEEDFRLIKEIREKNKPIIIAINKIDIRDKIDFKEIEREFSDTLLTREVIKISALKNIGIRDLKNKITDIFYNGPSSIPDTTFITRERHKELLSKADSSLRNAIISIDKNLSAEFIAADIRFALESLGEITGETYTEDMLNRIFQEFCIGK